MAQSSASARSSIDSSGSIVGGHNGPGTAAVIVAGVVALAVILVLFFVAKK